ncbi:hypothetical protein HPB50_007320 [Hyalomma asiaticum]|uniref:Uncharacterized protein n=1 Tax=Hyalomma asiaticum TaxID=266040 RepID=A0ACB7SVU8_HYAAI|nr:hypothetical protein HPB50_007320 [Hyalomma asiaticum]
MSKPAWVPRNAGRRHLCVSGLKFERRNSSKRILFCSGCGARARATLESGRARTDRDLRQASQLARRLAGFCAHHVTGTWNTECFSAWSCLLQKQRGDATTLTMWDVSATTCAGHDFGCLVGNLTQCRLRCSRISPGTSGYCQGGRCMCETGIPVPGPASIVRPRLARQVRPVVPPIDLPVGAVGPPVRPAVGPHIRPGLWPLAGAPPSPQLGPFIRPPMGPIVRLARSTGGSSTGPGCFRLTFTPSGRGLGCMMGNPFLCRRNCFMLYPGSTGFCMGFRCRCIGGPFGPMMNPFLMG